MGWAQRDVPSLSAPQQCPFGVPPPQQVGTDVALRSVAPPISFKLHHSGEHGTGMPIGGCVLGGETGVRVGSGVGSAPSVCELVGDVPVSSAVDGDGEDCDVSLEGAQAPGMHRQSPIIEDESLCVSKLQRQLTGAHDDGTVVWSPCEPHLGGKVKPLMARQSAAPDYKSQSCVDVREGNLLPISLDLLNTPRPMLALSQPQTYLFT